MLLFLCQDIPSHNEDVTNKGIHEEKSKDMIKKDSLMEMRQLAAYCPGQPVTMPEQLTVPLLTKPIDPEWKDRINHFWWGTGYTGDMPAVKPDLLKLRDRLLGFGGEEVCLPVNEPDIDNILQYGQLWSGRPVRLMKGKESQCHQNSAYLWNVNRTNSKIFICTGYALSDDGMWRQHSWVLLLDGDRRILIETTKKRVAYYGFVMDAELSMQFYQNNS